jgi:hypothetical protein
VVFIPHDELLVLVPHDVQLALALQQVFFLQVYAQQVFVQLVYSRQVYAQLWVRLLLPLWVQPYAQFLISEQHLLVIIFVILFSD